MGGDDAIDTEAGEDAAGLHDDVAGRVGEGFKGSGEFEFGDVAEGGIAVPEARLDVAYGIDVEGEETIGSFGDEYASLQGAGETGERASGDGGGGMGGEEAQGG
jgi:hypothetical protein